MFYFVIIGDSYILDCYSLPISILHAPQTRYLSG